MARATLAGPAAIRDLLNVSVSDGWPGDDVRGFFPDYGDVLEADPRWYGWGIWVIVHAADAAIIGDVGFKGPPDPDGLVEIGYSIVPSYRRQGFATEAARALVCWGLAQPGVTRVRAECYRDNSASIAVLTKLGLAVVAQDGDILRWEIPGAEPGRAGTPGPPP
jgi:ribosomal-protein-alanine N-acetyltransferase